MQDYFGITGLPVSIMTKEQTEKLEVAFGKLRVCGQRVSCYWDADNELLEVRMDGLFFENHPLFKNYEVEEIWHWKRSGRPVVDMAIVACKKGLMDGLGQYADPALFKSFSIKTLGEVTPA